MDEVPRLEIIKYFSCTLFAHECNFFYFCLHISSKKVIQKKLLRDLNFMLAPIFIKMVYN